MINIVNNLEFVGSGKKSTAVCDMFIKVDEENKILLVNNIVNNSAMDISSEGILKEVNSDIAIKIEDKLNINIVDYGVEILDDSLSVSYKELNDLF